MGLPWLDPKKLEFPGTHLAMKEPNGLLAAGGQLSVEWLVHAYSQGIFPWFSDDDPILWWTPSPRMVLYLDQLHISKSLKKALKKQDYSVTLNHSFPQVIAECASPRDSQGKETGTWITDEMFDAYVALHHAGFAHSVEVWRDEKLIGGLYGVSIGKVFFGESMFSKATNGSKIGFSHLVEWLKEWQYKLIDCQIYNDHLSRLGAIEVDRQVFEQIIKDHAVNNAFSADDNNKNQQSIWKPQDITRAREYWN